MRVSSILSRKGREVVTITPDATVSAAVDLLTEHNIGALVVSRDGRTVEGIVSERDLVRQLSASGAEALGWSVRDVMTAEVMTCTGETTVDELMATMTERRIRHIPVVEGGILIGLVSIGDVVKCRVVELEVETQALSDYVTGSHT